MNSPAEDVTNRHVHWEGIYSSREADSLSWFQSESRVSLELIDALGVDPGAAVLDVGGGASVLVDALLARGCDDVTVLDIAESALEVARDRVGPSAAVTWVAHDLLGWRPPRRYDLWHDRAVLHFMNPEQVVAYREVLETALSSRGAVILATFALDGPTTCSGLEVQRYDVDGLVAVLGDGFDVIEHRRESHVTPSGTIQWFTWVAARRRAVA